MGYLGEAKEGGEQEWGLGTQEPPEKSLKAQSDRKRALGAIFLSANV